MKLAKKLQQAIKDYFQQREKSYVSPYSKRWRNFPVTDFSGNIKLITSKRGLR